MPWSPEIMTALYSCLRCGSAQHPAYFAEEGRLQPPAPSRPPGSPVAPLPGTPPPPAQVSSSWASKAFSSRDRISPGGPGPELNLGAQTPSQGEPQAVSRGPTGLQVGRPSPVTRGRGRGPPGRFLGRVRERLGDFSPEIQTIGQSVLDRFRSSEVGKKIRKYSVKAIFSLFQLGRGMSSLFVDCPRPWPRPLTSSLPLHHGNPPIPPLAASSSPISSGAGLGSQGRVSGGASAPAPASAGAAGVDIAKMHSPAGSVLCRQRVGTHGWGPPACAGPRPLLWVPRTGICPGLIPESWRAESQGWHLIGAQ